MDGTAVRGHDNEVVVDRGEATISEQRETIATQERQKPVAKGSGGGANAVYGIGMIGAWVYYFRRATTNQERILAVLKGFVWPAFLVYDLLTFLEKE